MLMPTLFIIAHIFSVAALIFFWGGAKENLRVKNEKKGAIFVTLC